MLSLHQLPPVRRQMQRFASEGENDTPPAQRKFITREEEPTEYWISKGEKEGANPMKDPITIMGLVAIFTPFVILGIAIGVGYVDLNP